MLVKGRDIEVPGLKSELKRALINQSYSFPLMWLEDIPEAPIGAALVPHPNLPFGSLESTRPALSHLSSEIIIQSRLCSVTAI